MPFVKASGEEPANLTKAIERGIILLIEDITNNFYVIWKKVADQTAVGQICWVSELLKKSYRCAKIRVPLIPSQKIQLPLGLLSAGQYRL